MKILFMGTTEFSCAILETLLEEKYDIVGVVTQPDRPFGRKKELKSSPVKLWAQKHNIPVYQPEKIRKNINEINNVGADLIITCAYGQIVPIEILNYPKYKAVNIHASILPKYRGGAPIHKAIIMGEKETGLTLMKMDAGMDSGDILSIEKVTIDEEDTFKDVEKKLMDISVPLIKNGLPLYIENPMNSIPQNEDDVTFAYALKKEEELIDFSNSTDKVYNHIRGLIHWPIGYALLDRDRVKFHGVKKDILKGNPGEILQVDKEGVVIATNDGSVRITSIQPFGKPALSSQDFYNGFKDTWVGKKFNED